MTIFVEGLRHPIRTGAVAGTTRGCTDTFLDGANLDGVRRTVELGPGSGAVTKVLRQRLPAEAELLAVELNPALARELRRRCAGENVEVIDGSALDLPTLMAARGIETVDRVMCTMPITYMGVENQRRLLDSVHQVLDTGGELNIMLFAHSTHTAPWRRFENMLSEYFKDVERGPTLWWNLPPLRAFHCRSPVRG